MRKFWTLNTRRSGVLSADPALEILRMTDDELLADLAARGETVADITAAFRRIHAKGIATLAATNRLGAASPPAIGAVEQAAMKSPPALASGIVIGPEIVEGLAYHEELACAGRGFDADATGLRRATLMDLFGRQDWESIVAVSARGTSMEGVGINDGDTLLVDHRRTARDGDIVLVHLAGRGQLIKRLRINGPFGVALESAHVEFETIVVEEPEDLTIHGVIVGRCGKL